MKRLIFLPVIIFMLVISSTAHAEKYGTYVKVAENIQGTFDNTVKSSEEALTKNGWQILASYSSSVPEACTFRAHNIVIYSPEYARQIMSHGPRSSFAAVLRVGIYEDGKGINIAFTNPASLNRTVLGDKVETELSVNTMNKISEILSSAVKGTVVNMQIGEIREKGRVGGMGGGDFNDMIEEIYKKEDSGDLFSEIAEKVKAGIESNKKNWKLIYTLDLPGSDTIIYGVNKAETEARAYTIAGEKRESKNYRCPGIDHVPAFPIEVVVYREKGMVKVVTLDEMYRMKLYFEDAGMWAFMKNMAMPGAIQREITEISTSGLK
ncbi:hypothetical protein BMS3Abin07_02041 [bacterium BMS3Abin07]|nr:hypothetical protein BMS3Abin07_02041 [bacterium BMS3Abin07]GBE32486.1 hypothetical protein BMS3Bbin05_01401 [bacterium BMS3Bbin05]HDL19985.1 hypothetical protein [Nitrospirota bacterium]HDO22669.1 hypothetical protein [Nitrospirota bacterium]HDZ87692.1 hypothetical protein [Nitrospirota bacterium]